MGIFKTKRKAIDQYSWEYEVPTYKRGNESLDDMSLLYGQYENYVVTKTGYLVGYIRVSGINLDLLNEIEQEDAFDSYNAFLMATVGTQVKEVQQYIELSNPVNLHDYNMNLKKTYLNYRDKMPSRNDEDRTQYIARMRLIASYVDHFTALEQKQSMLTKEHLLVARVPLKNRTFDELELARQNLEEKLSGLVRDIESSFIDFEMEASILSHAEISKNFKLLINYIS